MAAIAFNPKKYTSKDIYEKLTKAIKELDNTKKVRSNLMRDLYKVETKEAEELISERVEMLSIEMEKLEKLIKVYSNEEIVNTLLDSDCSFDLQI